MPERLTGYEAAPRTGLVDRPPVIRLDSTKLPLHIEFDGRLYVLISTRNGGLILNRTY